MVNLWMQAVFSYSTSITKWCIILSKMNHSFGFAIESAIFYIAIDSVIFNWQINQLITYCFWLCIIECPNFHINKPCHHHIQGFFCFLLSCVMTYWYWLSRFQTWYPCHDSWWVIWTCICIMVWLYYDDDVSPCSLWVIYNQLIVPVSKNSIKHLKCSNLPKNKTI